MNARVVGAGLLAGVAAFAWGSLSHMVLGLGEAGVSALPNQPAVLDTLARNVSERGLYIFPYEADPARWEESFRSHPHGILALSPAGEELAFPRRLAIELATSLAGGLLAAMLFAAAPMAFGTWKAGAMAGAALGLFGSIAIDASYWNWYGFPTLYLAAQMADQILAWAIAGALLGWRLGKS